jgi:hydrogenase maturation protein HypF
VGFRPFVYLLATDLGLSGWVSNDGQGVRIEVEGPADRVAAFRRRLHDERPALAQVVAAEFWELPPAGLEGFRIASSEDEGPKTVLVLPDIATCAACLSELFDPADRRHRYPFLNCTHCGPRYSIVRALPYDRSNTSMAGFPLCPACRTEYENPLDRRFHAQPVACPACGPRLIWRADCREGEAALTEALRTLRDGGIVAVKAIGGFHLMVNARDGAAVARLRERKRREHKPFALLARSLAEAGELAELGGPDVEALASPQAPIVLVPARPAAVAAEVAPENPNLGVMLPSNPLQHLIAAALDFPLVATSGNLSDEPICIADDEAATRLAGVADGVLGHDRPIVRPVDDSVVRVMAGRQVVLRRARGFAPLPVASGLDPAPAIAFGAHLKASIAISVRGQAMLGQHIGDLETPEALAAYDRCLADLPALYETRPEVAACDLHPDYLSSARARASWLPCRPVQHHVAHALACLAENESQGPALAAVWDGTGLGADGTIWGGEFLWIEGAEWRRVAWLRPFPLPGGDAASRDVRRSAAGLLWELFGANPPGAGGLLEGPLRRQLERRLNCPATSSIGRLFDAVSALLGRREPSRFEGEAAMGLEFMARPCGLEVPTLQGLEGPLDPQPMVEALLRGGDARGLAHAFHLALATTVVAVAQGAGARQVALTGGCFQNRLLLELCVESLREAGITPLWHQRVPPNDGGLALGQLVWACSRGGRPER